jgi:hypothetical protein
MAAWRNDSIIKIINGRRHAQRRAAICVIVGRNGIGIAVVLCEDGHQKKAVDVLTGRRSSAIPS